MLENMSKFSNRPTLEHLNTIYIQFISFYILYVRWYTEISVNGILYRLHTETKVEIVHIFFMLRDNMLVLLQTF
jgi:hypothetical protein